MIDIIKADKQIKKFCMYGFFKNLKFFEPYLYIYLLSKGYSLFFIGLLFSIREIIVYLFEIPSGIIADHYGKKKELMMCFVFYILSFVGFFIGNTNSIIIGMMLFGLGEAFRSGTHKAMIISYLEMKDWSTHKTYVYGRTRSFSLLGSALSSLGAIFLVLFLDNIRIVFLITIIPYILDFILIASYPNSLDEPVSTTFSFKEFSAIGFAHFKRLKGNKALQEILISSATFDGLHKSIKDYIQPIIVFMVMSSGAVMFMGSEDDNTKVILGVMYFVFYMSSSILSKNLYKITQKISATKLFNVTFLVNSVLCMLLVMSMLFGSMIGVILSFLLLYLMKDGRRPLFVELSSNYMIKSERATMLSIESQLRAIIMIVISPLFGWLVDHYGINIFFAILSVVYASLYVFFKIFSPYFNQDIVSSK